MEQIDVAELDNLNTKFKLVSLWISSVANDWWSSSSNPDPSSESSTDPKPEYNQRMPDFFTHVKSLTLHYCCSIRFEGPNLPAHLRQLKIIGNNAMDMFIYAVDNIPNASEQLENVFIYTIPRYDMSDAFWLDDFRRRLGRCKGLKELTLIIAGAKATNDFSSEPFDVGLSRALPNNIERLEFHCSNSEPMLTDLDLWIKAAKDSEWLPRLKHIRICIYDAKVDDLWIGNKWRVAVDRGREGMISEKIRRVYEVLKQRNPPVEVGN